MIDYNTFIVLSGTAILGILTGTVGVFALLRGRALLGDTVAHASLPGLWIAFWLAGERTLPVMLIGALASGMLAVAALALLRPMRRVREDAALGIVLSVFFGIGLVISVALQHRLASASKAGLDSYIFGKASGLILSDIYVVAGTAVAALSIVVLLYKEFTIIAFDTPFAASQGWPTLLLDFLLMVVIAITVVLGLPAVGVVMMAALLIIPGITAMLWMNRLPRVLPLAAFFGGLMCIVGTLLSAYTANLPTGPAIVLTGTVLFVFSLAFAPKKGLMAAWHRQRDYRREIAAYRLLDLIASYQSDRHALATPFRADQIPVFTRWSRRDVDSTFRLLLDRNWIQPSSDEGFQFTEEGIRTASAIREGAFP